MREESPGSQLGPTRVPRAFRKPAAGGRPRSGRIRYAHGGALPPVEPHCTMSQGEPPRPADHGDDAGTQGPVGLGGDPGTWAWRAGPPVGGRHGDLWVLVCGGIAAAAAFAAAFVAAGGAASHPATPGATMPAVVSQACPAPSPAP